MLITQVQVHVKPEFIEAFKQATVDNATQSVQEPGVARFDVLQMADDPTHFILIEVYKTADAPAQHKATAHYLKWRDAVAPMMAQPRSSAHFHNIFPEDAGW